MLFFMQALRFISQQLHLQQIDRPKPTAGEALLKLRLAGICNTDLEIVKGYMGFEGTLGHEFVAQVQSCEKTEWIGKRVVCDINCACRQCPTCLQGDFHHCPQRTVIGIVNKDGAFAEYLTVPYANLYEVPESVSDEQAVFTEPLAAAMQIGEQINLREHSEALVIGDGKLGLLIALSLQAAGVEVSILGRHPERLERLGVDSLKFLKTPPLRNFSLVVEATGCSSVLDQAIALTQPRGVLVLKSTYEKSFEFNPALVVINEIQLIGSRCGPFDKALKCMQQKALDPSCLIDKTYALAQGLEAMQKAAQKGVLKILLQNTK